MSSRANWNKSTLLPFYYQSSFFGSLIYFLHPLFCHSESWRLLEPLSCRRVTTGFHLGPVASLSQGHTAKQTSLHLHTHSDGQFPMCSAAGVPSENTRRWGENTKSPHNKALGLGLKLQLFLQRRSRATHCSALSLLNIILAQEATAVKTHCRQILKS